MSQRFISFEMPAGDYQPHPDPNQEKFFVALLREAIDRGAISKAFIAGEIQRKHVRADIFDLLCGVGRKTE